MTWARLAFRLQPSSIGFAAVVCLALAGAAQWQATDMRSVLIRESAALLGATVVVGAAAVAVVQRRRPE